MLAQHTRVKRPDRLAPVVVDLPSRTMAVVHSLGDPSEAGAKVLPSLYGAVYTFKFAAKKEGIEVRVEPLRARWDGFVCDPGGNLATDRSTWEGAWGIPLPDGTETIPQKSADVTVAIERWEYGTVAQILHEGPYRAEPPSIQRLREFIADQGYEIVGPHEEEYLARPTAKVPRTITRYNVRRRSDASA